MLHKESPKIIKLFLVVSNIYCVCKGRNLPYYAGIMLLVLCPDPLIDYYKRPYQKWVWRILGKPFLWGHLKSLIDKRHPRGSQVLATMLYAYCATIIDTGLFMSNMLLANELNVLFVNDCCIKVNQSVCCQHQLSNKSKLIYCQIRFICQRLLNQLVCTIVCIAMYQLVGMHFYCAGIMLDVELFMYMSAYCICYVCWHITRGRLWLCPQIVYNEN